MRAQYAQTVIDLLPQRENIRNIAIIAHVDHGKTTLVDSLLSKAGIINQDEAGSKRLMDTGGQEKARGITIKSTGISLVFNKDSKSYLVNLVDSPGHVDFSSEVTAALCVTDGALVVVDCVEGVCVQTEMVIRQALTEQIRPVLHINKVDRGIMELQLTPEDLYLRLQFVIDSVNLVYAKFEDLALGDVVADPRKGNVSFGSGKQGWAFTLPMIAKQLAKKTGKEEAKILKRLWGDHYYDPATKRYTKSPISSDGKTRLERFVCQALFKPLLRIFYAIRDSDFSDLFEKIIPALGITLSSQEKELRGNDLLSKVLQLWLPAGDALLGLIVDHLPSPVESQKYRVDKLYTGPLDDPIAAAIRNCDPNGPLVVFISKMVPTMDGSRFFAFGRVFSGTITSKSDVYILNSDYVVGKTAPKKKVSRLVLMMAKFVEAVDSVPCGNTVGIGGIESALIKSGTVTSEATAYPIAPMKFSVYPVVRRAISPTNVADLAVFTKGVRKLVNQDPGLELYQSPTECVIAGTGELHIECAIHDLSEILGENIPFKVSPPVVKFTETVFAASSQICLAKSTNKLNRFYVVADPLEESLVVDLENNVVPRETPKELAQSLREYGWDKTETAKIWWFEGTNCLVDRTHAVPYLPAVKDHIVAAVQSVCAQGGLCGEPLRGVRFSLVDAMLHSDNVHRSSGQVIPAAKRAFLAAQLCAQPTLVEPVFLAEIQADPKVVSKIYSLLSRKRAQVIEEIQVGGSSLVLVRAKMPVLESFGFDAQLREATSGYATPTLVFSHWEPMIEGNLGSVHAQEVRERRKMKPLIFSELVDKL